MQKIPLAILVTDLHLNDNNETIVKSIMSQASGYAQQYRVPILGNGDLIHSRKGQTLGTIDALSAILDALELDHIQFNTTVGNHEKVNLSSPKSYLDVFTRGRDFFKVIDTYVKLKESDDCIIWGLSYFPENSDLLMSYLKDLQQQINHPQRHLLKFPKKHILMYHGAIETVRNNDGSQAHKTVALSEFDCFDLVLCGHYHEEQVLSDRIKYIGATFQHNFGESSEKGIVLLYDDLSLEYLPTKFPQYINLKIDVDQFTLDQLIALRADYKEDFLRLTLSGDSAKIRSLNTSKLKSLGIDIKTDYVTMKISEDTISSFKTHNKSSLADAFIEFCQLNKIENISYGQKIMEQL